MPTLNLTILPAKALKGGRHKVRIAVAHNGTTRYLSTSVIIDSDNEWRNGAVAKRHDAALLNARLRKEINDVYESVSQIPHIDALSCSELISAISAQGQSQRITISQVHEEMYSTRITAKGTKALYAQRMKAICGIIGDLPVSAITRAVVTKLHVGLQKRERMGGVTLRSYMIMLKAIVSYAKSAGYASYKVDPFFGYTMPQRAIRDSWLSVDEIRRIRDYQTTRKSRGRARDMFMLSLYLGGINMVDLQEIDFRGVGSTLTYIRQKTAARNQGKVTFAIPDEAKAIIARMMDGQGRCIITRSKGRMEQRKHIVYHMKVLSRELNIPQLVYYSARKSFSQIALQAGVQTSVIDYILGHSLGKTGTALYHYIYVTPEMASDAIRKVCDVIK